MKLAETVSLVFYLMFFIGWYMAFSDSLAYSIAQSRAKSQVQAKIKHSKAKDKKSDKMGINEYLEDMLAIVEGKRKPGAVIKFYELSAILGIFGFFGANIILTAKVAPLAAIIGLCLPLAYYRSKLQEIRNEASMEGEILATELLNNYKVSFHNILEAVRNTAETLSAEEAPHSKRMLLQLAHEFNTVSTKEDVEKAVERFKFGINTTWASLLATNIELAQTEGLVITSSMEDLISSIIKARKAKEEIKRQGSEGRTMLKYLVPAIYIITVISGTGVFDMTLGEFFHKQFRTDTGSTWFVIVIATYIGSILFANFISKEKMDI